jgi:transcriptional regulator with XRE-family HTH domain
VQEVAWHEGDVCHKLRRVCGWTVLQLAKEAKLNPALIYRLEDGRTKEPKRATIAKLATAFRLTPRQFMDAVPRGGVHTPRLEPAAPTQEHARRRA